MKVIKLGDKQIVLTDEQVAAMKTLAAPLLNFMLATGGMLITPEHPKYEEVRKLLTEEQ